MNISDLNYIEAVSEETNIEGGLAPFVPPFAIATAYGNALALGTYTQAKTYTDTKTVAGLGAEAHSGSSSASSF